MKLLSIAIPCYNSQDYMAHCIESLLPGGEDVEILIVNDGSKDDTAKIADEYAAKYPTIVKAIHKENGGHGSAVNTGIENATGIYFKVVDSDDWVKEDAYLTILEKLRELTGGVDTLDLLISNFVYEKEGERRKKVMRYKHVLPEYRMFGWEDVGRFHVGQYILMHSVIYRTKLLRECGLKLPEHTFYVDNIYVFEPLPQHVLSGCEFLPLFYWQVRSVRQRKGHDRTNRPADQGQPDHDRLLCGKEERDHRQ